MPHRFSSPRPLGVVAQTLFKFDSSLPKPVSSLIKPISNLPKLCPKRQKKYANPLQFAARAVHAARRVLVGASQLKRRRAEEKKGHQPPRLHLH
jgi:hypothetical protein